MNLLTERFSKVNWRTVFWQVITCTALGALFYVYLHVSTSGDFPSIQVHYSRYGLAILSTNLLGFLVLQIDSLLNLWLQWKANFLVRFLVGFIVNVSVAIGLMFLVGRFALHSNQEELLKLCILYAITVFIYEIFYGWFYSYRYYAVTQVEELRRLNFPHREYVF